MTLLHANNKCADQPAQRRRLISAFVIRYLESKVVIDLGMAVDSAPSKGNFGHYDFLIPVLQYMPLIETF